MLKPSMKQRSEEECSTMSIVLGKDVKGNEVKMGYGTLYKGDPDLKTLFYRFVDWYNSYDANGVARHGIYSITARRTNFYIYDHPAINALCSTLLQSSTLSEFLTSTAMFFTAGINKGDVITGVPHAIASLNIIDSPSRVETQI